MDACFYGFMQTLEQPVHCSHIEFDGFDEWPGLRRDLLTYIDVFCADMTLAHAREWFDEAFPDLPGAPP